MTTDLNTLTAQVAINTFDRPNPPGISPFGELVMTNISGIPLVGTGDTSVTTLTGTLPRNFVYRLVEMRVVISGPSEADMDLPEFAMLVTLTVGTGLPGQVKSFGLYNQTHSNVQHASIAAFAGRNPSVTNDFVTFYTPVIEDEKSISTDIIDASQGTSTAEVIWVNTQADTAALNWNSFFRFLIYSVDQNIKSHIWTPTYTL